VLAQAVTDVDRDLAGRPSAREVRDSLEWLLAAVRPVIAEAL